MKKIAMAIVGIFLFSSHSNAQESLSREGDTKGKLQGIYKYTVEDINGEKFDFATLKGKKIMIVNTASECGNTPQYKELEELYTKYKNKNFVIIGFPSNDFGAQEPGSNEQILEFCKKNYGVSFPMMGKIGVKGKEKEGVYQFLTEKSKNGLIDNEVKWNFQKYLINENGELVKVVDPKVSPKNPEIIDWIVGKKQTKNSEERQVKQAKDKKKLNPKKE